MNELIQTFAQQHPAFAGWCTTALLVLCLVGFVAAQVKAYLQSLGKPVPSYLGGLAQMGALAVAVWPLVSKQPLPPISPNNDSTNSTP